jgi:hypothetical protein
VLISCDGYIRIYNGVDRLTFNGKKYMSDKSQPAFTDVDIIPLKTSSDCLMGNFCSMEILDSFIFVQDNLPNLYIFRNDGKFLCQVGKKGEGPGEYSYINTFYIDKKKKQVAIVDEIRCLITKYDFEGKYISSVHVPLNMIKSSRHAVLINDSSLFFNHTLNFEANAAYTLSNNNFEKYSVFRSYNPIATEGYTYEFSGNPITKNEDGFNFIMPLSDTIYSYFDGSFNAKYIVDLPSKMIPVDKFRTTIKEPYSYKVLKYANMGYFSGFISIYETNKYILLDYLEQGLVKGYFLANKNDEKGDYYLYSIDRKIKEIPFFEIKYSYNDVFVAVVSAQNLLDLKDKIDNNVKNPRLVKLNKIIEKIRFDDNPILFFYHLK